VSAGRLPWVLCAITGIAILLNAVLKLLIAGAPGEVPADHATGAADALWVVVSLAFALAGALIASRQAENAIGWILCGGAVAFALSGLAESYAIYTLFADPGALWGGGDTLAWLSVWIWAPGGIALFILLPLLFPNGTPLTRRWRAVVFAAATAAVLLSMGIAFTPGRFDDFSGIDNPYGAGGLLGDVMGAAQGLGWLLTVTSLLAAAASLVLRLRRARGIERLQLKWFAAAGVCLVAGFLLWWVWEGLVPLGIGAMAVAVGRAVLRYKLYDIDVVLNRALVYGAVTAILAGSYLAIVLVLQLALEPLTSDSGLAIAASTLAVAALFRPLRGRIQELVDSHFYRRKYDAAQTIASFGVRMRDEVDLDSIGAELRRVAAETMQPTHLSLWMRTPR
jgi:hypothetical protein